MSSSQPAASTADSSGSGTIVAEGGLPDAWRPKDDPQELLDGLERAGFKVFQVDGRVRILRPEGRHLSLRQRSDLRRLNADLVELLSYEKRNC